MMIVYDFFPILIRYRNQSSYLIISITKCFSTSICPFSAQEYWVSSMIIGNIGPSIDTIFLVNYSFTNQAVTQIIFSQDLITFWGTYFNNISIAIPLINCHCNYTSRMKSSSNRPSFPFLLPTIRFHHTIRELFCYFITDNIFFTYPISPHTITVLNLHFIKIIFTLSTYNIISTSKEYLTKRVHIIS